MTVRQGKFRPELRATLVGDYFAVHHQILQDDYALSHVPSGLQAVSFASEEVAIAAAKVCVEWCRHPQIKSSDKHEAAAAFPKPLHQFLKAHQETLSDLDVDFAAWCAHRNLTPPFDS